jgi:hypothetical protein
MCGEGRCEVEPSSTRRNYLKSTLRVLIASLGAYVGYSDRSERSHRKIYDLILHMSTPSHACVVPSILPASELAAS